MSNLFMHLTNYAINKTSKDFVQPTEEEGDGSMAHKMRISEMWDVLEEQGYDVPDIKA